MFYYAWGLGTTTNNIAEAFALYAGLKFARERNIPQLLVFGDSVLIVKDSYQQKLHGEQSSKWYSSMNHHPNPGI
jgi:ribonuclease HI